MKLISNIRFALLQFHKNLSSSLLGVFVLAIGLAIAISMFTLSKTILWNAPVFKGGQELKTLNWVPEAQAENGSFNRFINILDYEVFAKENTRFSITSAMLLFTHSLHNPEFKGMVRRYNSVRIDGDFFGLLDVKPILGRLSDHSDTKTGAPKVALIGYNAWQSEYEASPDVIGKLAMIDGQSHTIIGVLPEGFLFPLDQQIWIPGDWAWERGPGRKLTYGLTVAGLLKPGVTDAEAELELANIAAGLKEEFPETNEHLTRVKIGSIDALVIDDDEKTIVYVLLVGAILTLIIACANVSNLLTARMSQRQFELAIRKALGASRKEICTHVLLDAAVICILGTVLAFILSGWACRYIWNLFVNTYDFLPYWWSMEFDFRVFLFSLFVLILSICISSASPLSKILAKHNTDTLKDSARTSTGLQSGKTGKVLVGMQILFTMVLLTTASFFVIDVESRKDRKLPFSPENILVAQLNVNQQENKFRTNESIVRHFDLLEQKLKEIHGVEHVAFSQYVFNEPWGVKTIEIDGKPRSSEEEFDQAIPYVVTNGYFNVFDVEPVLGRFFTQADTESSGRVVVVSQNFVNEHFPSENPIGKKIRVKSLGFSWEPQIRKLKNPWTNWMTIIGVSPNIISNKGIEAAKTNGNVAQYLGLYVPQQQWPTRRLMMMLTGQGKVERYIKTVNDVVAQESHGIAPFSKFESIESLVKRNDLFITLISRLIASFAIVSLIVASTGLFGLASFVAQKKTKEFGVRRALGAGKKDIIILVMLASRIELFFGLVLGFAISFAVNTLLDQALGEPGAIPVVGSWLVYLSSAFTVSIIMAFAVLIPAWRASLLPPNMALRQS